VYLAAGRLARRRRARHFIKAEGKLGFNAPITRQIPQTVPELCWSSRNPDSRFFKAACAVGIKKKRIAV